MGKYILYAGILSAALDYGANAAEGHLFSFIEGKDMRAENGERLAAVCGEKVYKRLGNKKYLIRNGEQIVMLDMEDLAEREVINWELVERIEKDATENLRKMRENGHHGGQRQPLETEVSAVLLFFRCGMENK